MGVVFTNNAETTLAAAISSTSATSISVSSSSSFPSLAAGEYFYATVDDGTNHEIVKVTGISGTTWTVVRAADNSTARTIANGSTVQLRATSALLTDIQENIAAKSANQTVFSATAASNATAYNVGVDPGVEANASIFLDGVYQNHDTFSFDASTVTFDAAPTNGTKIEIVVDNLINLQSSNLTTDTFTATSGQTAFTLSDAPAAENNLLVFIEGAFQDQGNYSISNHTLTLATGAVEGRTVTVYIINPVNIGTPSDNTVTSAKLSGNITTPGTLTVGSHNVSFDSPTFVVDHSNSRVGLGTSTPSVPVDIVGEVKISSHLNLPDNAIAKFGTGGDLQIYHDGSNSYIKDLGTGNLAINTNGSEIMLTGQNGSEYMIRAIQDGAVELYHNAVKKLATASGGVTVTGVVTASSLDISGDIDVDGTTNLDIVDIDGAVDMASTLAVTGTINALTLAAGGISGNASNNFVLNSLHSLRINIDSDNNATDQDFIVGHNQATTNQNSVLFKVQENGRVGIGTTAPAYKLHQSGTGLQRFQIDATDNNANGSGIFLRVLNSGSAVSQSTVTIDNAGNLKFFTGTSSEAERMRIDASGKVGIGMTANSGCLLNVNSHVRAENSAFLAGRENASLPAFAFHDDTDTGMFNVASNILAFSTAGAERARVLANGDIVLGNTVVNPASGFNSQRGFGYDNDTGIVEIATTANAQVLVLGKNQGTDGTLVEFRKQSTVVGSIGTQGGDLNIGTAACGIAFIDGVPAIYPFSTNGAGSTRDAAIDLGDSGARFKDLYLSGTIAAAAANIAGQLNVTGTTNSNTISMSQLSTQFDTSSFLRLHPASTTNSGGYTNIFFGTSTANNFGVAVGGKRAGTNNEPTFSVRMLNDSITGLEALKISASGVATFASGAVFNENSNDADFRVESNGVDHMFYVDGTNNKVKIGTASTLYSGGETMSVQCGSSQGIGMVTSGASAQLLGLYNAASSGTRHYVRFAANSGGDEVGKITSDGTNTTYATSSDARLKDVTGIARGLEVINELNPVAYNWKSSGKADEGLIAQEVQKIVPNAVVEGEEEDEMYCMDYSKLVVHLVAGMKEQQTLIESLTARITTLEG